MSMSMGGGPHESFLQDDVLARSHSYCPPENEHENGVHSDRDESHEVEYMPSNKMSSFRFSTGTGNSHDFHSRLDHDSRSDHDEVNRKSVIAESKLRSLIQSSLLRGSCASGSAVFYASVLHARKVSSKSLTASDALLYARALVQNREFRRAIQLLERSGLLIGRVRRHDRGDNISVQEIYSTKTADVEASGSNLFVIESKPVDCIESAILASYCLEQISHTEDAISVLEEVCRYPFPTSRVITSTTITQQQLQQNFPVIEESNDMRLHAMKDILIFNENEDQTDIHPLARLCYARGKIYDITGNPSRAVGWLQMAISIDIFCVDAMEYLLDRHLMSIDEESSFLESLRSSFSLNIVDESTTNVKNSKNQSNHSKQDLSWLRDLYFARWNGNGIQSISSSRLTGSNPSLANKSQPRSLSDSLATPTLSFGVSNIAPSPFTISETPQPLQNTRYAEDCVKKKESNSSDGIEEAFSRLHIEHSLGKSADVLALAAHRAYSLYRLPLAAHYCSEVQRIDPFCPRHQFLHVVTLFGLKRKHDLFHLSHQLVELQPKSAVAWFSVGCYYHLCGKYELAQRHFGRSTRLEPRCAEAWIAFGCSFAASDESDQALAAFRAAQRLHNSGHHAMLYMGMEYLRTNHMSLAYHFLSASSRLNPYDPLSFNELGLCSYRQGHFDESIKYFERALKLCLKLDLNADLLLIGDLTNSHKEQLKPSHGAYSQPSKTSQISRNSDLTSITDCVRYCGDPFWEPIISNLGQSYRKIKRYEDAKFCFEKSIILKPVSLSCLYSFYFRTLYLTIFRVMLEYFPLLDLQCTLWVISMGQSKPIIRP